MRALGAGVWLNVCPASVGRELLSLGSRRAVEVSVPVEAARRRVAWRDLTDGADGELGADAHGAMLMSSAMSNRPMLTEPYAVSRRE